MNGSETVLLNRVNGLLKGRLALQDFASPLDQLHSEHLVEGVLHSLAI